jgi:hypothetical protein
MVERSMPTPARALSLTIGLALLAKNAISNAIMVVKESHRVVLLVTAPSISTRRMTARLVSLRTLIAPMV